ncbi:hypothetical protein [Blautia caecimuris]|uniref:hypothetical protein n=1 Tax=Blautia caecimuris TaxID=1796615 RepID=UPI003994F21A
MWISKKKCGALEKRIADLEKTVRSQQEKDFQGINHQRLSHLESPEKLVSQCAPSDSGSLAFRVNLNSRKLFEQSVEPKD